MTYGLPGVGKSRLARMIGTESANKGYDFGIFNSGMERRENPKYSWIKTAADFERNPEVLDEISADAIRRSLDYLLNRDVKSVAIFDQTGTRKTSREKVWEQLASCNGVDLLILEIYMLENHPAILIDFNEIAKRPDYQGKSIGEVVMDFQSRRVVYKRWATHYMDDPFFLERRIGYMRLNILTGTLEIGNSRNIHPELLGITLSAINKHINSSPVSST